MRLIVRAFRCHLRQFLHCMRFAIRWESLRQLSSDKNLDSQIVSHFIFRHLSSHFYLSLSLFALFLLLCITSIAIMPLLSIDQMFGDRCCKNQ